MEKQEDEVFCPECGKLIKRAAVICVNCGVQIKKLQKADNIVNPYKTPDTKEILPNLYHAKNKMSAVIMVVFLGFFGWLYTYKHSASKFWAALSINGILLILSI